jgi:pimeloyl-ACP methyl ester carboxylesterase
VYDTHCAGERALPEEEADDLHALLQALHLGPAVLYGVSSGARVSLLLAHKHPEVRVNITGCRMRIVRYTGSWMS